MMRVDGSVSWKPVQRPEATELKAAATITVLELECCCSLLSDVKTAESTCVPS